jgi:hypothetical protein
MVKSLAKERLKFHQRSFTVFKTFFFIIIIIFFMMRNPFKIEPLRVPILVR